MDTAVSDAPRTLEYLTVQDMLWVNLQLAKVANPFNYALLEEATFYQYGYGESHDLIGQAAKFLTGFAKKQPFYGKHDAETAFIGCIAFLALNGKSLEVPVGETRSWLERVTSGQIDAKAAIEQLVKPSHDHHPDPAACLKAALAKYGRALTA
jgi:prophage maintenance system killer protein